MQPHESGGEALLIFADDWGRHPSSCQHLVHRLSTQHEIAWVNTIGMRPPRLDLATLSRGLEKLRHWSRSEASAVGVADIPRVLSPRMWPWFRSSLDRRINRDLLSRQLRPIVLAMQEPPIVVTTIPIVADLVGHLPATRWVYYCVDDFSLWPGLDCGTMERMEANLLSRVDIRIAASDVLRDRLAKMGHESALLTHGVDLDHWTASEAGPPISSLSGLPRPLIVFWGVVDRRLDFEFLRCLAERITSGTILLVGPEQDPDPRISSLDRVVKSPALPYERLPSLAREAAVLIMPYADLPVTRAMQPLKLKEYLATGRPVVVTNLPATRPWRDALDLAPTPEAFASAVLERVKAGVLASQQSARLELAWESWEAKAEAFEAMIGRVARNASPFDAGALRALPRGLR